MTRKAKWTWGVTGTIVGIAVSVLGVLAYGGGVVAKYSKVKQNAELGAKAHVMVQAVKADAQAGPKALAMAHDLKAETTGIQATLKAVVENQERAWEKQQTVSAAVMKALENQHKHE